MSQETDDGPLKRLLFDTVEGIEELEILAWFAKGNESGDSEVIARSVALPADALCAALERLSTGGLLEPSPEKPGEFRPATKPATARLAALVVSEYRANPARVMKLMTENAIERVRTAALHTFAESFRIRKPRGNG
ncbi:MAG TPA: hypothetical protein VFZ53_01315 [Polyangiaceae bacterium]